MRGTPCLLPSGRTFTTYVGFLSLQMGRRFLTLSLAALAVGLCSSPTHAATRRASTADGRIELPGGKVARAGHNAVWMHAPAGREAPLRRLQGELGAMRATWDPLTLVPSRVLLEGVDVPDAMTDPAVAEAFCRDVLSRHVDLLAPGSRATDFVLVSNDLSAGIRSVGFAQTHDGLDVLGGQISFRFKHGRLLMIGSEAFPNVALPSRVSTTSANDVDRSAERWLAERGVIARSSDSVQGPFVLPLVDEVAGTIIFREVFRTHFEASNSAWDVYIDAGTGAPIGRRQTRLFGTAQLRYDVPQRTPAGPRFEAPADLAFASVQGETLNTAGSGHFNFDGNATTITTTTEGVFATVFNQAGPSASASLPANDGGVALWRDLDEEVDAQLSAYVHTMIVKDFVRTVSTVPWLDEPIPVNVNIDDTCNAFSDGNSINFYSRGGGCENTALLADVVYHEFGHSLHSQSLVPGVGSFNVALSEGISDYLAATLVDDSGIGRGLDLTNEPLRELNPDGFEWRWPEDRGEVHDEGRIIGGALWDLRTIMRAKLGDLGGRQYTDRLWYETTRRAVDIPSMYPEALLFDDDDGNLLNGTPNACEINAAYGPHGLFSAGPGNELVTLTPTDMGPRVDLALAIPNFPDCPVTAQPTLSWRLRGEDSAQELLMVPPLDQGGYSLTIPQPPDGSVLEYQVHVNYDNGTERALPDNFVDPWYEAFIGTTVELGCLDVGLDYVISDGWVVGPWMPGASGTDPTESFGDGDHIHQLGDYSPFSNEEITFETVATGLYTDVRLHMWRWLTVEDGYYDQAYVEVNDERVWSNFASLDEREATLHHIDKEWRFDDIDVSEFVGPDGIAMTFGTSSDGGLQFGGWTIAAACLVAVDGTEAVCGDGRLDAPVESCDDGNLLAGDGCDANCQTEIDPVPPLETDGGSESSDVGTGDDSDGTGDDFDTDGDTDTDSDPGLDDGLIARGCVCAADERGGDPKGLVLLMLLLGLRRRR